MNDFLSGALSFANVTIFCLVVLGCVVNVYEGELELFVGIAVVAGSAVACGFIATQMVIKRSLESINTGLYRLRYEFAQNETGRRDA
jgi:ribose/xylose/arabinose/galactoside ABC-type transport system permease subunit